jgi:hypothetical protein
MRGISARAIAYSLPTRRISKLGWEVGNSGSPLGIRSNGEWGVGSGEWGRLA